MVKLKKVEIENLKTIKVQIEKVESLLDTPHPNGINEGYLKEIITLEESFKPPVVGEYFLIDGISRYFRSSIVREIIDENTFRTENSIYKWKIL